MHCKIINRSFDFESVFLGGLSIREYLSEEKKLISKLLDVFSMYSVKVMGFERRAPVYGRQWRGIPPRGELVGSKVQARILKDILRKKYWAFICLSERIGVHIEGSEVTVSNLSNKDISIFQKLNIDLEDASYLEVDDIYSCEHYRK